MVGQFPEKNSRNTSVVALGLDTTVTDYGWNSEEKCAEFPGSCWMPLMKFHLERQGFRVMLSSEALALVEKGKLDVREVGLVHLDGESASQELLRLGCDAALITQGESPIAIPDFYDRIAVTAQPFRQRIFFSGVRDWVTSEGQNDVLYFPAYSEARRQERLRHGDQGWSDRFSATGAEFLSFVGANNYWRRVGFSYYRWKPRKLLLAIEDSPEGNYHRSAMRTQLHDTRLRAISYFSGKGEIAVYGRRWDQSPMPFGHRKRKILQAWQGPIETKSLALSSSKFNLCAENCSFPGYVTEKIFDAFIAGTVPIYFGAPNILDYVPHDSFINGRDFSSFANLRKFLRSLTEDQYRSYLSSATSFLASERGFRHTYEAFAQQVAGVFGAVAPKE